MTVAELNGRMSSPEFTQWIQWYQVYDLAKAGKLHTGAGNERGNEQE